MNVKDIQIPMRMEELPLDKRGYPITYITQMLANGQPDFSLTSEEKRMTVIRSRLCAICGQSLDYWMFFIGGEKSMESRYFADPAMHEECARYSIQVCPFLRGDIQKYREKINRELHEKFVVRDLGMPPVRPVKMGLGRSRGYVMEHTRQGTLIKADPFKQIEWF